MRDLIRRHVEETQSPRGQWVLDNFDTMLPRFVKVFPHEFKRVQGIAKSENVYMPVPVQIAVSASAEVARG